MFWIVFAPKQKLFNIRSLHHTLHKHILTVFSSAREICSKSGLDLFPYYYSFHQSLCPVGSGPRTGCIWMVRFGVENFLGTEQLLRHCGTMECKKCKRKRWDPKCIAFGWDSNFRWKWKISEEFQTLCLVRQSWMDQLGVNYHKLGILGQNLLMRDRTSCIVINTVSWWLRVVLHNNLNVTCALSRERNITKQTTQSSTVMSFKNVPI